MELSLLEISWVDVSLAGDAVNEVIESIIELVVLETGEFESLDSEALLEDVTLLLEVDRLAVPAVVEF